MQSTAKDILLLLSVGAFIQIGKLLNNHEKITPGLFIGRVILGSFLSLSAGAILIKYPDASPLAICGAGSAMGIAGHQIIEIWIRQKFKVDKTN
ncbi:phage holin family protein [Citrobacter sp. FP75]|uniref:phage holin family protein n=1 Tax=Citrobacter sp. FP75 TaxID=1852949 RepID=UPI001BC8CD13|nr:phage holin family protein [Citrobacter sp. FP75]